MPSEPNLRLLRLEWLTAQILLLVGVIIGVGGLYLPASYKIAGAPRISGAAQSAGGAATAQAAQARQFCSTAVATAKEFGIVPSATHSSDAAPAKTDVQGRYVCAAENGSAAFTVSVDLICRDVGAARCFSLFNVAQSDGTVLYQRQDEQ